MTEFDKEEVLENFNFYSKEVSTIIRSLTIGGFAIIWLFKNSDTGTLDRVFLLPLFILILSILIDFVQYLFATFFWHKELRRADKELSNTVMKVKNNKVVWVTQVAFILKIILTAVAYMIILAEIYCRIIEA